MTDFGAWVLRDGRTMFYMMIDEKKGKRFVWKVVLCKGKITKVHWKGEGTSHNLLAK